MKPMKEVEDYMFKMCDLAWTPEHDCRHGNCQLEESFEKSIEDQMKNLVIELISSFENEMAKFISQGSKDSVT